MADLMEKIYTATRQIVMAVTGLERVYLADQPEIIENNSYATIRVGQSVTPYGRGAVSKKYDSAARTITVKQAFPLEFDIIVNFYRGAAMKNALYLVNCSRLPTVHAILLKNGMGWKGTDNPVNLTALQSSQMEQRAAIVIHILAVSELSEATPIIEHTKINLQNESAKVIQSFAVDS